MKSVSSGKTRGSHPHHRRKKKTKSYVKFPKRLKKRKSSAKSGKVLSPLTLFDAKFINNIAYPKDKKSEKKNQNGIGAITGRIRTYYINTD